MLLDLHAPGADEARRMLAAFAELEKSPEHVHSYRITALSLWNAAGAGLGPEDIIAELASASRYPLPANLLNFIRIQISRYGSLRLYETSADKILFLQTSGPELRMELEAHPRLEKIFLPGSATSTIQVRIPEGEANNILKEQGFFLPLFERGRVKQILIKLGYPVQDLAPLRQGQALEIPLRKTLPQGKDFEVRDYQAQAVDAFLGRLQPGSGFGTLVLPCGAGKTIVGILAAARLGQECLILTSSTTSLRQWIREILEKTELDPGLVGEYSAAKKQIRPITLANYQILSWRRGEEDDYPHFEVLRARNWGLIIYDEVHLLPAPVFRITAELQSVRRLGLTATLIREDGLEKEVFSLVGPKRFDLPWKDLEARGWIASAQCIEYRVQLPKELHIPYAIAGQRQKYRVAAENPAKLDLVDYLLAKHQAEPILIIGHYLSQLGELAKRFKLPLLDGKTPQDEREALYAAFRQGEIRVLVLSKVANFAVDLPDASVAIQISGTFGSRQEEAQRLGRILRPKDRPSFFYTLVSAMTLEEEFSANRQKFLAEQGYDYRLEAWE